MAAPPPRQSAGPAPTRGDAHPAHAREDLNTFPPVLVVRTTEAGTRPSPCRPLHAGRAVDERRLPCRQGHESSTGPAQKAGRTGRQEARGRREREEGGERNDFATFCWRHGAVNRDLRRCTPLQDQYAKAHRRSRSKAAHPPARFGPAASPGALAEPQRPAVRRGGWANVQRIALQGGRVLPARSWPRGAEGGARHAPLFGFLIT